MTPLRKTLDIDPNVVLTAATLIFLLLRNLSLQSVSVLVCVCVGVCVATTPLTGWVRPPSPRWLLFVSQYDNIVAVQTLSIKYLSLTKRTFT